MFIREHHARSVFCVLTAAVLLLSFMLSSCTDTPASDSTSQTASNAAGELAAFEAVSENISASEGVSHTINESDLNDGYDEESAAYIYLQNDSISTKNTNAGVSGSTVYIKSAGTYYVSGTLNDGQIIVEASKTEQIHLILSGVTINCSTGPAIYIKNCEKAIITLEAGTVNSLSDGTAYVIEDAENQEPDATLFCKDDLTINGAGALQIQANYADGIACKDNLVIISSFVTVNAADDGIRGTDSITIRDAAITVTSVNDAIKSTQDIDEALGSIAIESGTFKLKTSGSSTTSAKGIKAASLISVGSGSFNIDAADDAIHSNGSIVIDGGTFNLSSSDDGIHANTGLTINDGTLNITKSYEGIEASDLVINGGTINISSSDDGINAAGGTDSNTDTASAGGGFGGRGDMFSATSGALTINGGSLFINSTGGDGIDVNGDFTMSGGGAYISSASSGADSAVDYDGSFKMEGGILVGAGLSQMAMAPGSSSSQYSILANLSSSQNEGSTIKLTDSSGNEIASFTPAKSFNSIVISTPDIQNNSSYTLLINSTNIATITTSGITTTYGSTGMGGNNGGMGGGMFGRR